MEHPASKLTGAATPNLWLTSLSCRPQLSGLSSDLLDAPLNRFNFTS
jgi:hypothetical protein